MRRRRDGFRPVRLPAVLRLKTGDRLPVSAYFEGVDADGVDVYVVRAENGGPLDVASSQFDGLDLDEIPARASVRVALTAD